jgi:cyclic-di-GMP-binding biofilm dispersal mediator protein
MNNFAGKCVLVIGGSRGIGAAIVRRFAAAEAKVAFTYANAAEAAVALANETNAVAINSDATNRDALIAIVSDQAPLDILVVSAGAFIFGDPLTLDPDAIDSMIDLNVKMPYHAAVGAARQMVDGGRIIVIGSTNGDRIPFAGAAAYAMTKSALQGMARGLARDFGKRNITVNVVQPGPTDTDMNPADGPMSEMLHGFMAIERHASGDEIAGLVAYLASPEAAMITGAVHAIDGGFAA